jgi:hypothetical protein
VVGEGSWFDANGQHQVDLGRIAGAASEHPDMPSIGIKV